MNAENAPHQALGLAPRKLWLRRGLLLALPATLYAMSLGCGLLGLDDQLYYLKNPALHRGGGAGLIDLWRGTFLSDYAPVSNLTLWLDLALFGDQSWWGARLHGMVWFGLGAIAVHEVILRITARPGIALAVALLYAVHPICAPSVLWLAERKHLVCFALSFFCVNEYIRAREQSRWSAYALAVVLAALALLAKPHATAIPLMLAAFELSRGKGAWPRRALPLLPFVILAAAYTALNLIYLREDLVRAPLGGSRAASLASDGPILVRYLFNMFCPAWLAFYYHVEELGVDSATALGAWAALAAVVAATTWAARERSVILCGWMLGLAAIAPALNLVPQLAPMADHYLQWALPGLLIVVVTLMDAALQRLHAQRWALPLTALACILLGVLAFKRIGEFSSLRSLFETAVVNQPASSLNWGGYANELASSSDAGDRQLAGVASIRALRCDDAARLLAQQRALVIREAALFMYRDGHAAEAWGLALDETAKFDASDKIFADMTLAEVAGRTDHPDVAIAMLEPMVTAEMRAVMATLREKTRDGRQLPNDVAPMISVAGTGRDAFSQQWGDSVALRGLQVLGVAYLKKGDAEKAFDIGALLVNTRPDFAGGRAVLAAAYNQLGLHEPAIRIQP